MQDLRRPKYAMMLEVRIRRYEVTSYANLAALSHIV
jgi:hypothetical protein